MRTMHYESLVSLCLISSIPSMEISATEFRQRHSEDMDRPNIVWFLVEDLSPHYLSLYNEGKGADTPNVRWLAQNGIIYTNAYSNAPVSSAARTTLITGCYAPRFAGSFHRKLESVPLPDGLRMFPSYLRDKGYYTCNASKTDYNVKLDETAWNEIKGPMDLWRNRPNKDQPFFFQRNNGDTHESCLQFNKETYRTVTPRHSTDSVFLHPTLPDTDLMRYTYATFYDRIEDADKELGSLIDMLRADDVLDNTIIFWFGDNGGSLPGTKGYTDDIGIHVPLVVYVPERWREKLNVKAGSIVKDIVSFMDFGPTVLNLAGVEIPKQMDGKPFLGKSRIEKEDFTVGYGDRFDELYAFNRVLRKGKFRYARNFQPYHSQSLFAFYRYKQLAFREWKDLYRENGLNEIQQSFFKPFEVEELYDLEQDPFEKNNLANNPQYKKILESLRRQLCKYLVEKNDLGFFPETVILEEAMDNPAGWGRENQKRIGRFIDLAQMQIAVSSEDVQDELLSGLRSEDPVERWWALTTCSYWGQRAINLKPEILPLLDDERSFVRSRALVFLSLTGERFSKSDVMAILDNVRTGSETLLILNDLTYLYESGLIEPFELSGEELKMKCSGVAWRLQYLNSYVRAVDWNDRWEVIYKKK